MTSSLRTDTAHHNNCDDCRFPDFVSSRGLLTCDDARCLSRCHRAFVSSSCHFFGTPLSVPWLSNPRESATVQPSLVPQVKRRVSATVGPAWTRADGALLSCKRAV